MNKMTPSNIARIVEIINCILFYFMRYKTFVKRYVRKKDLVLSIWFFREIFWGKSYVRHNIKIITLPIAVFILRVTYSLNAFLWGDTVVSYPGRITSETTVGTVRTK